MPQYYSLSFLNYEEFDIIYSDYSSIFLFIINTALKIKDRIPL